MTTQECPTGERPRGTEYVGRRYVQLVLVLGALAALGPLTIDTYLPALPQLTAALDANETQAQMTLTGMLLGLGLGQLVIGPLSDALGRRRPLMVGLAAHVVTSLLCAVAPSISLLIATRLLQGLAGAAVTVISMAIVRDLFSGNRAANVLSRLILVMGVAPILAPSLGSLVLQFTSWRGIFVVVALGALLLLGLARVAVPETLPPARRQAAHPRATARAYRGLVADPAFVAMVAATGLSFATLFAYVGGSTFVLQEVFGLSSGQYGVLFGLGSVGFTVFSQINPVLIRRWGSVRVLTAAVTAMFVSGVAMLTFALLGAGSVASFMVPAFAVLVCCGLCLPNSVAVALQPFGDRAGTAAAFLGAAQFGLGALSSPVVGALSNGTATPVPTVIVATSGLALAIVLSVRRRLAERHDDSEAGVAVAVH